MGFLVQMRQSIKCGTVKNHEITNLHKDLVQILESTSLPPARHQPNLSTQIINQEKAKNPEIRSNSQQIISNCLGLSTPMNPGLREVDLIPSCKRGSDKINMLK